MEYAISQKTSCLSQKQQEAPRTIIAITNTVQCTILGGFLDEVNGVTDFCSSEYSQESGSVIPLNFVQAKVKENVMLIILLQILISKIINVTSH